MAFKESFQNLETKLKNVPNRGSFYVLQKEVVESGKCIACGACVSVCNYHALSWNSGLNKPQLGGGDSTGKCIACGVCYHECPQSTASDVSLIGNYVQAFLTRNQQLSGQDGGTASTLIHGLFRFKLIDAAIVVRKSSKKPWYPEVILAKSESDLGDISGSIYAHAQVSAMLFEAVRQGLKKIAIVGCPCKAAAVKGFTETKEGIFKNTPDVKIYNIGLFCMEAFIPEKLHSILEGKGVELSKVAKMDFSGGKFRIYYKELGNIKEFANFPISALHEAVETSCKSCLDFTAECSDIAFGGVGAPDGYNMVLARTTEMADIINRLITEKVLESKPVEVKDLQSLLKVARSKKEKVIEQNIRRIEFNPDQFKLHRPEEWHMDRFHYTPELHTELYQKTPFTEHVLNSGQGKPVFVAKTSISSKDEITRSQYASTFDLTIKLLKDYPKVKDGKILIKPNNTGFIGIFKHDVLAEVIKANKILDDADHQPIATQPGIIAGMVDALLELGVKRIDIGENMLWDGGAPRAFYETGYTQVFSDKKYRNKVFFIDYYEDDPPTNCLEKVDLPPTKYCKGDYYNACYPPKSLFAEKYDLILIASVAKSHNCAFYTLSTKNFSVSWNPRNKTGKIEPRWHIHGVPLEILKPDRIKEILGADFKRLNKIFVRETYRHKWDFPDKQRVVHPNKGQIILSNGLMSTGLIRYFKSWRHEVLDVDPHHWSGINIGLLTLGMGYLINRYTRIFAAVVNKLRAQGTEVATICSGIVGQEGDGPLVYGSTKYAGFNVASFDHTALERVVTDLMFGESKEGYLGFLKNRQARRMQEHKIECPELQSEVDNLWTLHILHDLIGGNFDLDKIPIHLLNYTKDQECTKVRYNELFRLRAGPTFRASLGYYCNPDLWLKLMHNNKSLYIQMFLIERGSIEIPLIPGVVG